MGDLLDYMPIAAAAFAIPRFAPAPQAPGDRRHRRRLVMGHAHQREQRRLVRLLMPRQLLDGAGPGHLRDLLAGTLAIMLARRGQAKARPAVLISNWGALITGCVAAGRTGLGTLLAAAFILQVTPSLWTAYRTAPHRRRSWNLAAHPRRAVLLDHLRPPPVRPTPAHPWRHRCHRQRAHACPDPPDTPNPTAQQCQRLADLSWSATGLVYRDPERQAALRGGCSASEWMARDGSGN